MPKIGYLVNMNRGWDDEKQGEEDWRFYSESNLPRHYTRKAKRIVYWEVPEDES